MDHNRFRYSALLLEKWLVRSFFSDLTVLLIFFSLFLSVVPREASASCIRFAVIPSLESVTLQEKVDDLEKEVNEIKSKSPDKDLWDKLNATSGLISGGLVTIIGILATYVYNERQRKNSKEQKLREIAVLQAQTVQSFMPQLQSEDSKAVEAALLAITALGNSKLATDLAALFNSEGSISALEKIAVSPDQSVAEDAQRSLSGLFSPLAALVAEIHGKNGMVGCGFLIGANGEIVTTDFLLDHLEVQNTVRIKIGDSFYDSELVSKSPDQRLALLRVANQNLSYLELAENLDMDKEGTLFDSRESVFMLKPEARSSDKWKISTGKLIGVEKDNGMDIVLTTIRGGSGSAGSPVVNQYGQVVGMSFAQKAKSFGTVGLLIPASSIFDFVQKSSVED